MDRIPVEHFTSPANPEVIAQEETAAREGQEVAPASITIVLDGETHEVAYEPGERLLRGARGSSPPSPVRRATAPAAWRSSPMGRS